MLQYTVRNKNCAFFLNYPCHCYRGHCIAVRIQVTSAEMITAVSGFPLSIKPIGIVNIKVQDMTALTDSFWIFYLWLFSLKGSLSKIKSGTKSFRNFFHFVYIIHSRSNKFLKSNIYISVSSKQNILISA